MKNLYSLKAFLLITISLTATITVVFMLAPDPQKVATDNIKYGDQIIFWIGQYRNDHGTIPETLDMLVPKYTQKVVAPSCATTDGWKYWPHQNGEFDLSFSGQSGYFSRTYYSASYGTDGKSVGHWQLDRS
jgi:hypothetical protein